MAEEIELAAKSVGESVGALAEASGVLGPVKELAEWLTSIIHYRRQPALAKVVMKAADKIREEGLPPAAVSDKQLRDVLTGASMEDDESMQERWANLLANAMTESTPEVHAAFPRMLCELEPVEVRLLDWMTEKRDAETFDPTIEESMPSWFSKGGLDNLTRLGLLRELQEGVDTKFRVVYGNPRVGGYTFTTLGWEFIQACRTPQPASTTND